MMTIQVYRNWFLVCCLHCVYYKAELQAAKQGRIICHSQVISSQSFVFGRFQVQVVTIVTHFFMVL
jgi:hypothetical protein